MDSFSEVLPVKKIRNETSYEAYCRIRDQVMKGHKDPWIDVVFLFNPLETPSFRFRFFNQPGEANQVFYQEKYRLQKIEKKGIVEHIDSTGQVINDYGS